MKLPVPGPVIARMRRRAFAHPWPGDTPILDRRHVLDTTAITEPGRPTRVMVTFDVGYHASCWFKNADYEQCLHVSVSHPRPDVVEQKVDKLGLMRPRGALYPGMRLETPSDEEARAWGRAFFEEHAPKAWVEPAASVLDPYRMPNVVHLRLYYDGQMRPFIPEGEVYDLKPWSSIDPILDRAGGDVR